MSEGKNVHPYRREHLEPEIAAMSVEMDDEEDDPPALIVNIDDPNAKGAIGKVIIWIFASLGGLIELMRRTIQAHPAAVLAGTALVTTVTAVTVDEVRQPPPIAVERIVTLAASPGPVRTVTATATLTVSARPATPLVVQPAFETSSSTSRAVVAPTTDPTAEPSPRKTPRHTHPPTTPTAQPPTPPRTGGADPPPTIARSTASATKQEPSATPAPPPNTPPPSPREAAAGCDGVIEIDLHHLPDICLLG